MVLSAGEGPSSAVGPLAEVVDVVMAARRLEGWSLWCQLSALARLLIAWSQRPPLGDASRDGCQHEDRALADRLERVADDEERVCRRLSLSEEQLAPAYVAAEIGLACGLSRTQAAQRVAVARALVVDRRHPRVSTLARAGFVDWGKLDLLVVRLGQLDDLVAACVEEQLISDPDLALAQGPVDVRADPSRPGDVLPLVTRATQPELRQAIDAAVAAIDPDGMAERAGRARGERHVSSHPESDGMARLQAYGPAEAVAAAITDLDAAATAAKAAGDTRTRDQISTDEFFHRLTRGAQGAPAVPCRGTDAGPPDAGDSPDDAPDTDGPARTTSSCSCGGASCRPIGNGGLTVGLTMPLATWLGLAADPGQLAGYGPVAAALARQIAADAARDRPLVTTRRCVITDNEHGTVIGIGRPIRTSRHDPPPRLAALIRATDPTCVFPGCTVPVQRCDLDHRNPYPHGPTCACNLQALCRSHHRLKTGRHITVRLLQPGEDPSAPPGTLEWTTRAGRTYRSAPAKPVPPSLRPALISVPARLARLRHARAAYLRDLNARLRAELARTSGRAPDDDPAPPQPERPLETWPDWPDWPAA